MAWPWADPAPLERAGIDAPGVLDVIGAEGRDAVAAAERGFARVWARVPLADGRGFRELVCWRGESLLWVAESFLARATAAPRCAATAETSLRLLEATDPAEVDAGGLAPHDALLLSRAATAHGVLFHGEAGRVKPLAPGPAMTIDGGRAPGLLRRLVGARPAAPLPGGRARVALVADDGPDGAVVRSLEARLRDHPGLEALLLPLEALAAHETGRARAAVAEAERSLRDTLARLRGTPGLLASYAHRGVAFAEPAALDLEAVLLGHLPVAVRLIERSLDALDALAPALVVVAIGDRDRRRAVGLAARLSGVPWAAATRAGAPEERVDAGPQPAARFAADGDGEAAATRVLALVRDSVGRR